MYPEELVLPMKADLTSAGYEDLTTAGAVADAINTEGTVLVVVNSVCGCAAGNARPAAKLALENEKSFQVPNYARGIYLIKITGKNTNYSKKIYFS